MRRSALVAVLLAGAVALAGCSGSDGGSSGGAAGARVPSPSGSPNGLETKSAADILATSVAAATKARTVHVRGSFVEHGERSSVDLWLVKGRGSKGTLTGPEGRMSVIVVGGRFYGKAGPRFWRKVGGGKSADQRVVDLLADRWVRVPTPFTGEAGVLMNANFTKMFAELGDTKVTKGREAYVDDHRVVGVVEKVTRETMWILLDGAAYPLRIVPRTGDKSPAPLVFSDWNATVVLKAPKDPLRMSDLR